MSENDVGQFESGLQSIPVSVSLQACGHDPASIMQMTKGLEAAEQ